MGGAFAATADDPSAIFYNVAGIAQQRHTSFLAGGTFINFTNEFTGDPNDAFTSAAPRGQYERHTFVPPNAYAIMPIGTNLTFGVGVFTPFGLRTDWEDPVGRPLRLARRRTSRPSPSSRRSPGRPPTAASPSAPASSIAARASSSRNHAASGTVNVNPFTGRFIDVANSLPLQRLGQRHGLERRRPLQAGADLAHRRVLPRADGHRLQGRRDDHADPDRQRRSSTR